MSLDARSPAGSATQLTVILGQLRQQDFERRQKFAGPLRRDLVDLAMVEHRIAVGEHVPESHHDVTVGDAFE